jgi:small subunit ribosomal protein S10
MAGKIRIRLKAFDHVVLDQAAADIVRTSRRPARRWPAPFRFR